MSDETHPADRPATFREVFASREFRSVFAAYSLSWFGDYLAKAAVTALVYDRTNSVALSAATFALTYLPWVVGGPLLSALADRHRYRRVMITCDLLRMSTISLVAIPGMPIWGMLVLLFLTALANPPAQAAKSALMPLMLDGDRLVVGLALNGSSGQAAQVCGYLVGAAMAPFFPEVALLIDGATFGLSALLIRLGVRDRPPATTGMERRHLVRETADGFGVVFGTPVLRAIAVLVFASVLFAIVPEGLAAAWSAELSQDDAERGLNQGLIMAANPIGFILGGLMISRLVNPSRRQTLVRPFAVLAPASLVPALLHPSAMGVALMAFVCGFAVAGMMPTANGLFVQALPHGYRARAFGVMQSGVQIMQGIAVISTGLLADAYDLPDVVGIWSLAGVLLILLVSMWWPSPERFARAISAAGRASTAAGGSPAPPPGGAPPPGRTPPPEWPPLSPALSAPPAEHGSRPPRANASNNAAGNAGAVHRAGGWRPLGSEPSEEGRGPTSPNSGPRAAEHPASPSTGANSV